MLAKRKVEVFTAGCPICDEAVKMVKDTACESCEVIVYNLKDPKVATIGLEKARGYGIRRLPTVVVDGRIASCCAVGGPTVEGLSATGIGTPR